MPGLVTGVALIASATDLLRGKIYNRLNFIVMGIGLFLGFLSFFFTGSWSGLGYSVLGLFLGFFLYAWIYFFGAMGAGDVKFLMALGALGGPRFCAEVALLGVILGGIWAIAQLIFTKKLGSFLRRMYRFMQSLLIKELEPEVPKLDHSLTMAFGLPISIAAVWVIWFDPFMKWGRLW